MSLYGLLVLLIFINFTMSVPLGNLTHLLSLFRFSQKTSTVVGTSTDGWDTDTYTTSIIDTGEKRFDGTPPPVVAIREQIKPSIKNQAPPCSDGSTFCEKVDGYPGNILEYIFDNDLDKFKKLQGTEELKSPSITQSIDANTINEQSLCPSIEEVVFPKVAKTIDNKWLFVVNTESFVQSIRIEKCLKIRDDAEQSCLFNDLFPDGYKTVCKQKYIYRKLVALDDDGNPVKDTFLFPSCCSCRVIRVGDKFRQGMR